MSNNQRYPLIDLIRFLAIFLMVFFHFFYDLDLFKFVDIDFSKDLFWYYLPRLIVFLFLVAVGMSLFLVHHPQIKWPKFKKRLFQIIACALLISLSTYILFPSRWVYFGTLHCISFCTVLALPFISRPNISLSTAIIIWVLEFTGNGIPWIKLDHLAMDYIEPFPWFACVLLGIFAAHNNWHKKQFKLPKIVVLTSKHSLLVYMLHQPMLYSFVYLLSLV